MWKSWERFLTGCVPHEGSDAHFTASLHRATCGHKCLLLTFSLHTKARSHCQHSSPGPEEQSGDPSLWPSRLISARDLHHADWGRDSPAETFLSILSDFVLLLLLWWMKVLKELDLVFLFNLWTKSFPIWILNYLDGLSSNSPCSLEKGINNNRLRLCIFYFNLIFFYDLSS